MKSIPFLMNKLGFDKEIFKKGICFGCATMASQAFVLGEQAYKRYQIRLNRIESLVDKYTKLPPLKHSANSSNVDRVNAEEARFKKILKKFPPPNNYLDKGENEWVSMRAYLENIAIAQDPQLFNHKYKIFPNRYINQVNPSHFKMIAALTQSQLAEERGGFTQVGNFSGVYSAKEMKIVLNSWEQFMNEQAQSRSALIINNRKHSFMLGYDPDHKSWVMDDSSTVRKYNSSFLWGKQTSQLAKDIFSHVPLVQAEKIISSSDSEEKIIINTRVCFTDLPTKIAQLPADEEWKMLHKVTPERAKFQNKIGESWLSLAAQYGQAELVKELITVGSNVNLSVEGDTPLFLAAQNGHDAIVKHLINADADINTVFNGTTPLYIAAQNGHSDIVKVLIEAKADIDISPFTGCTPLYIAAQKGHDAIVKDLINAGADINTVFTQDGTTPLFMAAQNGDDAIVKDLINADADMNISPSTGCTPLYIAAQNGHGAIVKDLINAGSDINTVFTEDGTTPLFMAAQNGHDAIVKDLINADADINISAEGYTPLCIAKQNGHIEIVKELEKATNIDKLPQESTSETKKITLKDSQSKPEHEKQLKELLKAPATSHKIKTSSVSTQFRCSFFQAQSHDEEDQEKNKRNKGNFVQVSR